MRKYRSVIDDALQHGCVQLRPKMKLNDSPFPIPLPLLDIDRVVPVSNFPETDPSRAGVSCSIVVPWTLTSALPW